MKVAIRTDASSFIGTGHVMRCRTLADALSDRGAEVRFVCREHSGNLNQTLRNAGYTVAQLPAPSNDHGGPMDRDDYAVWLGVEQAVDAAQTIEALGDFDPDWLVVDHYGLDAAWERLVRPRAEHILVIDDLANRPHDCDVLLDQNFYADMESRYSGLLPSNTRQLLGPRFALLRPEFRKARESLPERAGTVRRIFVFFGGVDPTRETEKALDALDKAIKADIHVDVVVGGTNPHREAIRKRCETMPNTTYYCQASDMAMLMAQADLALGAGGCTTWERCALGLPSLVVALAANQVAIAKEVASVEALDYLGDAEIAEASLISERLEHYRANPELLKAMSLRALALVDCLGAERVSEEILRLS